MIALLLVDLQKDFMPGGPLGVPDADAVIPVVNALLPHFELAVATQDWHPPDHGSFAANHPGRRPGDVIELHGLRQILWPVHCVQNTPGAALVAGLNTARIATTIRKGLDPGIDSYSGFFDNGHRRATELAAYLRGRGVDTVYLAGVATDYCVKFTALDARQLGFRTLLIQDACRGVELKPGDVAAAIAEMRAAGVEIVGAADVSAALRTERRPT